MGFLLYLTYNLLSPFLFLAYLPLMLLSPKNPLKDSFSGLGERFSVKKFSFSSRPLWFHAASVGEVKALKPLIERLKREKPELPLFITCSTLAGRAEAFKMTEHASLVYADFYPLVKKLVKAVNPAKLIIVETELWPNLIRMASLKTEVLIINGRISDKTVKRYALIAPLLRFILKDVKKIMAQSSKDAERYASFFPPEKTLNAGNIKYDAPLETGSKAEELKAGLERAGLSGKKILVFGSTHPEEERIIAKAVKLLKQELKDALFIMAPRHLNRLDETEALLRKEEVGYVKWSEIKQAEGGRIGGRRKAEGVEIEEKNDFILVDEMGLLVSFYSLCSLAFVGGTLDKTGGHNLLEPSRFSKPVLFGPNYRNAREAGERLLEFRGGFLVKDEYDMKGRIKVLAGDPKNLREAGENSNKALLSLQGAVEKILKEII